jgi:zinc transporter ZupT
LFACSIRAKAQWIEVNGHTGGYVTALAVSGQRLFEGTSHGVYLFADNGTGWKTVNVGMPNMSVQSLACWMSSAVNNSPELILSSSANPEIFMSIRRFMLHLLSKAFDRIQRH